MLLALVKFILTTDKLSYLDRLDFLVFRKEIMKQASRTCPLPDRCKKVSYQLAHDVTNRSEYMSLLMHGVTITNAWCDNNNRSEYMSSLMHGVTITIGVNTCHH